MFNVSRKFLLESRFLSLELILFYKISIENYFVMTFISKIGRKHNLALILGRNSYLITSYTNKLDIKYKFTRIISNLHTYNIYDVAFNDNR